MIDAYTKAMEERASKHAERKAEQQVKADAAKKAALDDAARYMADLEMIMTDEPAPTLPGTE